MMRRLSGAFLAALLVAPAAPVFSKPPDLPQDPKIVVAPDSSPNPQACPPAPVDFIFWPGSVILQGEEPFREAEEAVPEDPNTMTESLREIWATSLFLDVDPFLAAWSPDGTPVAEPPHAEASQPESVCPYLREQSAAKPVRVIANPAQFRSVMDNLRALEEAGDQVQKARQLGDVGRYDEAKECLVKARALCPGSSYEKEIEQVYTEIISTADTQIEKKTTEDAEEQEPPSCGCCCGWLFQFGMCWMNQFADWFKEQQIQPKYEIQPEPPESDRGGRIDPDTIAILMERIRQETYIRYSSTSLSLSRRLLKPVSMSFDGESLPEVLQSISSSYGVSFDIHLNAFQRVIFFNSNRVHCHVEQMPLRLALEALLRSCDFQAEVNGAVVSVTTRNHQSDENAPGEAESSENTADSQASGSVCPKCEVLHAKYTQQAGTKEQVNGLMKACYLAIGAERFEKAADLARQAYALDPARVEGDPLIYKMHLLAEKAVHASTTNPDAKTP